MCVFECFANVISSLKHSSFMYVILFKLGSCDFIFMSDGVAACARQTGSHAGNKIENMKTMVWHTGGKRILNNLAVLASGADAESCHPTPIICLTCFAFAEAALCMSRGLKTSICWYTLGAFSQCKMRHAVHCWRGAAGSKHKGQLYVFCMSWHSVFVCISCISWLYIYGYIWTYFYIETNYLYPAKQPPTSHQPVLPIPFENIE